MSVTTVPEVNHLLTMREAAKLLTVSVRTLERLIQSNRFPQPVRIIRTRRVLRSDVTAYVTQITEARKQ